MFSGTAMYGNMNSNVLLKVQCTPYKLDCVANACVI